MQWNLELVLDEKAILGEGPSWDDTHQRLLWVDIIGQSVHVFHPGTGADRTIHVGQYVGAVVPRVTEGVLLVTQSGYHTFNLDTGVLTPIVNPEPDKPENRFNDGKCDPLGRFWAGTMNMSEQVYTGSLYCLSTDYRCDVKVCPVDTSNGITWSPDHRTLYYIDSPTKRVVAYDFDLRSGNIRNPRVVVIIPEGEGTPDGMTSDEEGMLWIAQWDGWKVSRWNPTTGERLATLEMPIARPTSCCFGGPDLKDLYITSARVGIDDRELERQPLAGGLFRVKTEVAGMPTYRFGQ